MKTASDFFVYPCKQGWSWPTGRWSAKAHRPDRPDRIARTAWIAWSGIISALLFAVCGAGGAARAQSAPLTSPSPPATLSAPVQTADGFALPQPGFRFAFPRDHGSHPEFKLEWWYLTGHLFAADGRRFGFQATFFRQAGPERSLQLYLAHMALLDLKTGRFLHQERLNRAGWDAAAAEGRLAVRNGPWSLVMAAAPSERMTLLGGIRAEATFALTLDPAQPLTVFGENSVSRKGADPQAASYYLTFARLKVAGELTLDATPLTVSGEAWMDHEISSSQLSSDQVGWDWVSVQLKDGREFMLYRLRQRDGTADPASTLQWVADDGRPTRAAFSWEVLSRWKSPHTDATYPARVRLATVDPATGEPVRFTVEPLAADQELPGRVGGIAYWEGACRVLDEQGRDVGSAYMELTGYAKELKL